MCGKRTNLLRNRHYYKSEKNLGL